MKHVTLCCQFARILALLAVILAGILFGTVYKKKPAEIKEETVKENQTYEMPKAMMFTAKYLAAAQANGQTVDVKIKAKISPSDAENQTVDYSVAWGIAPIHGKEFVTDYVIVTQDADGSLTATISCKKAFDSDNKTVFERLRIYPTFHYF